MFLFVCLFLYELEKYNKNIGDSWVNYLNA